MTRSLLVTLTLLATVGIASAQRSPQVVGGEPVDPGDYPFVVKIYFPGGTCTGSLVRKDWVLTAAHCGEDGAPSSVLIGDAESMIDGPGHVVATLSVAKWIPHPQYDPETSENDIALIQLAGDATQSPPRLNGIVQYVPQPIALATGPTSVTAPFGVVGLVGFGRVDSPSLPGVERPNPGYAFHALGLPTFGAATCRSFYPGESIHPARQFCYGDYPGDCSGDSGGPVFTSAGGALSQVGVVSYGRVACGIAPSVATLVPGYLAWINEQIDGPSTAPNPIQFGWELPPASADGVATGVSNAQGWAFSSAGAITSVRLERNGQHFLTLPCCAERGDVRNAIAGAPLLTGFSAAVNWGNFGNTTSTFTIVIRDAAGNERRESRTVRSVQILNGVGFARDLGFLQSTSCVLFNQGSRAFAECARLAFQQGTCTGEITFGWHNGKQAFEVVQGCH